jgi:GNAT superfamily N-acetyltransferase
LSDRPPILVRPARSTDSTTIALFNIQMALETENLKLDPSTVEAGVRALLDDPGKGHYFVAEQGAHVAGCLMVTHEWSDWRNGDMWWIQSVFVRPEHRGAGVFKSLFAHVETLARGQGVCAIRLYVDRHNGRAKQVYSKLGMSQTEYDIMHKSLDDSPPLG